MKIVSNNNELVTLDNYGEELVATPARIDLKTIDDIRIQMGKVFRDMKSQKLATSDGTRLVYVLAQIGKMIELHEIEKRVEQLEGKL